MHNVIMIQHVLSYVPQCDDEAMYALLCYVVLLILIMSYYFVSSYRSGACISKGRKCCKLVNAS